MPSHTILRRLAKRWQRQAVPRRYALLDHGLKVVVNRLADAGYPVSCASCSAAHCCKYFVNVYPEEAALVAAAVRNTPFEERLHDWWQHYQELPDDAKWQPTEYLRAQLMCPFQFEGRCAIYPIRPSSCRAQFVVSAPVECNNPDSALSQTLDAYFVLEQTYFSRGATQYPGQFGNLHLGVLGILGVSEAEHWYHRARTRQLQSEDPREGAERIPIKI